MSDVNEKKEERDIPLSYESDGEMGEDIEKKSEHGDHLFFNTTQNSE